MAARQRILITGMAGNLGRLLTRSFHRDFDVVGIDRRPLPDLPRDVAFHQVDIRRKAAENLFRRRDLDAVIHLNFIHDPRADMSLHYSFNLWGTTKLLEYCHKYGVRKFVFLSSANIYGPRPEAGGYHTEDAPLMASQAYAGIQDLIAVDLLVQSFFWKHPALEVVVLRPVHLVGPGIRNGPTSYLRQDPVVTLLGFDPLIQLVHSDDVIAAMRLALKRGARGIYNLAGPGVAPLSTLLRELGRSSIPVPKLVAQGALNALWKLRLVDFPPPELVHILYSCLVDDQRARRELCYRPEVDLAGVVDSLNAP
ncbi:MAG: SDR family oxidoreductase [Deltaproteobacteria bacterium]|nr:SDR family oxidoreductase [Deltaproteobacteria bacterium]